MPRAGWAVEREGACMSRTVAAEAAAGLLLGGLLALLIAMPPGCSTPLRTAYHTVDAVTLAVQSAMGAWAQLSVAGRTSAEQDAKVRALYADYQATMWKVEMALTGSRTNRLEGGSYTAAAGWAASASAPLIDYVAGLLPPERAVALRARKVKP